MIFKKFYNRDAEKAEFFAEKFNLSKRIMELILSRGIDTEAGIKEFLSPSVCHDPFMLKGMKEARDRILLAKELSDRILVFGDYDVDGVSATAIMLKTLKKLGMQANYYLPNRYIDGYGLTTQTLDKVIEKYNPQLIITVDCGISCYAEVEYAKNKGVDIIITDHHEIPDIVPDTIVINPKLEGQDFPFAGLCGTGVALKLAQALLACEAEEFLPIAAIATIADIVPLIDENRAIVSKGMKMFDKLPLGIKQLFKENKLTLSKITASDISFKIAPKINASGRMGDASDSLNLYLETDLVKVRKYIERIKLHNSKRQELCNKIFDDCQRALAKMDMRSMRVITLASRKWDQGVLGIVCSRLVEKYHKPVFLFSQVEDKLHGSGRSIDDINIHQLLSSLQDILETYGGHSMAAGLTLNKDKYEEFRQRVNAFVHEKVSDEVFIPIAYYDQEITSEEITPEFLKELELLEPIGCGNPKPRFKISVADVLIEPMKRYPEHVNITIGDLSLVYFNCIEDAAKMTFSRHKSFIFELQNMQKKGVISHFDGGSFIMADAHKNLFPFEIEQLGFTKDSEAKYSYYSDKEIIGFVASTFPTVFGTAFVSFSGYDYVNFSKNYSTQGIFHFGVCDQTCIGYNSLLLCPTGLNWAKNFSKIVFLSPILDEGYIAALGKVSDAEIFVPIHKKFDPNSFRNLDLSRSNFGRIYSAICTKSSGKFRTIFDLYNLSCKEKGISFLDFYAAVCVFLELELLKFNYIPLLCVSYYKKEKRQLEESKIYNKLALIKNILGSENAKN